MDPVATQHGRLRGSGRLSATVLLGLTVACADANTSAPGNNEPDNKDSVSVNGDGVSFAGQIVGPVPRDAIEKIQILFETLKERRASWKGQHPNDPFPGEMNVALPADISCRGAMSVLGTMAYAGYPNLTVTVGGVTHAFPFAVPRPPDPSTGIRPIAIDPVMAFGAAGQVSIEKLACRNAYDVVAVNDAANAVRALLVDSEVLSDVTARCEPGVRFAPVFDTLVEVMQQSPAAPPRPANDKSGASARRYAAMGSVALGLAPECVDGVPRLAFVEFRAAVESVMSGIDGTTAPWGRDDGSSPTPPLLPIALPADFDKDVVVAISDASAEIDPDAAVAAVASTRNGLLGCYASGLATNPNLRGRIQAALQFGKKGLIVRVSASGDLPSATVIECVRSQLYRAAATPPLHGIARARATLTFGPALSKKE